MSKRNKTCNNAQNPGRRIDHDLGSDAPRPSSFPRPPHNPKPSTPNHPTAILHSCNRLKPRRNSPKFTRRRKPDPEPEIGAQDSTELLHAEPRNRIRDLEPGRHVRVVGPGGQPEEADSEPGLRRQAERRAGRVTALEQRLEQAGQPLERRGTHPERELERVRLARDGRLDSAELRIWDRVDSVELTGLGVWVVGLLLWSFAFFGEE